MDRDTILSGERAYLDHLDDTRRPLEQQLFESDFASAILERGHLQPHELASIARWKWSGAATRVQSGNSPEITERFTRAAIAHRDDPRLAIWILTYLYGVHVRMASAILTVLFPNEYTVMDARAFTALETLGWTPDLAQVFGDQPAPADFLDRASVYECYLLTCRAKAAEFSVSLRTLDRFLYTRGIGADE